MSLNYVLREFDDHGECVGCTARHAAGCHPRCPFDTGRFGPGLVLRAATRRLEQRLFGCRIRETIESTARYLSGQDDPRELAETAVRALGGYLSEEAAAECALTGDELVTQLGLAVSAEQVTPLLYAAAARADGNAFDTAACGVEVQELGDGQVDTGVASHRLLRHGAHPR